MKTYVFCAEGNAVKAFLATTRVNGRGRWVHTMSRYNGLDKHAMLVGFYTCRYQHPKGHWLPSVPCSVAVAVGGVAAVVRENIQLRRASR
jgi:hypothetical protein